MKRTRRVIMSLLLVLALVGVPVSQVMAASYDATEDWSSQDLYPGDDLTGIEEGVSVTQDGEDVPVSDGTWTNVSDDLVYQATKGEGAISLTAAGYSLNVVGGSSYGENGESAGRYESGETVTISANEPEEGYVFTGWTTDSEDLLDDASSETVTFTMPAASVTVTANFAETVVADEAPDGGEEAAPAEEEEAAPEEGEEFWAEPETEAEIMPLDAGSAEDPDDEWAEPDAEADIMTLDAEGEAAEEDDADADAEPIDAEPAVIEETTEEPVEETTEDLTEAEEAAEDGTEEDNELQLLADGTSDEAENAEADKLVVPTIHTVNANLTGGPELNKEGTKWKFSVEGDNPTEEDTDYLFWGWTATYEIDGEIFDLELSGETGSEEAELAFAADLGIEEVTVTANYEEAFEIRIEGGRIESDVYWYLPGEEVEIVVIAQQESGETFEYWDITTDPILDDVFLETLKGFDCYSEILELKFTMPEATVILTANTVKDTTSGSGSGSGSGTSGSGSGSGSSGSGSGVTTYASTIPYKVTVENGKTAYEEYYPGEIVTITADYPTTNQEFKSWSLVEGQTELADPYRWETTFTMPEHDVTVAATYKDGPSYWIEGITEGATYESEERLTFTPVGGGMDNTNPNLGDIRYVPTSYTIGNVSNTWSEGPYTTSMSIQRAGEYTLTVTFTKQLWNGSEWEDDGTTALSTVTFYIEGGSGVYGSVNTGDNTPVTMIALIALAACLIFIILLVVFIRRRRRGGSEE